MVIRVKSVTKEQFRQRFDDVVKTSEKHDWKPLGLSVLGQFEGTMNGDRISLARTPGIFSNLPQRSFEGSLSFENGELVVRGTFRFSKLFYAILTAIALSIFLFLLFSHTGRLTLGEVVKGLLFTGAVSATILLACLIPSLFLEKEVIRMLETL